MIHSTPYSPRHGPPAIAALLLLLILLGPTAPASGAGEPSVDDAASDECHTTDQPHDDNDTHEHATVRPQDKIWVVNARRAGGDWPSKNYRPRLGYLRYQGKHRWESSDLDAFLADDQTTSRTLFWVHGNRLTASEARCQGLEVYRVLVAESQTDRPIRFIIFSWPSDKVPRPLIDVRLKAKRSKPAGCQLAWLVDQMNPDESISMIGFSFGARVITEALHLLGGGMLHETHLYERNHQQRRPIRVVLGAAATDNDCLEPGNHHGKALSQIECMLIFFNARDWVIRRYYLIERGTRARALGLCGVASLEALGDDAEKIVEIDVNPYVGRSHEFMNYLLCPDLTQAIWSMLMGSEQD